MISSKADPVRHGLQEAQASKCLPPPGSYPTHGHEPLLVLGLQQVGPCLPEGLVSAEALRQGGGGGAYPTWGLCGIGLQCSEGCRGHPQRRAEDLHRRAL